MKSSKLTVIIISVLGIIISGVFYYVQFNTVNTYNTDLPYISLGDNIKNKSTKAHLWFEEFISGDESIVFERDVESLLIESEELLSSAIQNQTHHKQSYKLTNPELIEKLQTCKQSLTDFKNFAIERKNTKEAKEAKLKEIENLPDSLKQIEIAKLGNEEAGSEADQMFDESYDKLQVQLDDVITYINNEVGNDIDYLNKFTYSILGGIILLFVAIAIYMYKVLSKIEAGQKSEEYFKQEMVRLDKLKHFVNDITSGEYNSEVDLDVDEDELANSLVQMRDTLKENSIKEKDRNWTVSGMAKFGEILRHNNDNLEKLSFEIISNLVKYVNANQGGIFVVHEDKENNDEYLELTACYAYERQKFMNKKLMRGEGLVGQCWQEGQKIFLTDVPSNYINITSGLGDAPPSSVLLFPMVVNFEIYGVIELASFNTFSENQIDFMEKVGESIASTIKNAKVNSQTNLLLAEAQEMTETMRAQEEEMRQNMEEMQATSEQVNLITQQKDSEIKELKAKIRELENKE